LANREEEEQQKKKQQQDIIIDDTAYMDLVIRRLYEIQKEGSAAIRDFYTAYDAQKKKEDERRKKPKPNSTR
jgi:hypothetical protein